MTVTSTRPAPLPASSPAPQDPARGRAAQRWLLAAAALAVAAGLALRFVSVGPLWLDEAQSVAIARLPLGAMHAALRQDGAPPLYYLLLHGWMALFGSSTFAVRALSGLFSLASVPAIWYLARPFGRRVAATAVLLLATLPWSIRYGSETRMYALMALLMLGTLLAVQRVWRRGSWAATAGVAVGVAALLYTHYWALFVVAALGVWSLRLALRPATRQVGLRLTGAVAVGVLAFLPWVPDLLFQSAHTGAPWTGRPSFGTYLTTPVGWAGAAPPERWLLFLLYVGLLAVGLLARRLVRSIVTASALILLLGYLSAVFGSGAYMIRYTAPVVPLFVLALALGVRTLPLRWQPGVLAAICVLSLVGAAGDALQPRTQAGTIGGIIERLAKPGDLVVYCPDQLGPAVSRVLGDTPVQQLVYPTFAPPQRVDWVDYAKRQQSADPVAFAHAVAARARGHAVWLVWSRYRTVGAQCAGVSTDLGYDLGRSTELLVRQQQTYEHAWLERWGPR